MEGDLLFSTEDTALRHEELEVVEVDTSVRFELLIEENRIGHWVQGHKGDCIRKMNISEVFGQITRTDSEDCEARRC